MSALRLAIFDCDGVLVDSEPLSARVLAELATDAGWDLDAAAAREAFQGWTLPGVRDEIARRTGAELDDGWMERYERERDARFRAELQPVDGAPEAVRAALDAGLEVCVASQGSEAKMALTLGLTGLDVLIGPERRFSAAAVANPKPAPDLFEHAASACGTAAGECVVIEDSPLGVQGARAAGMAVLAVPGRDGLPIEPATGVTILASMHEAAAELRRRAT